MTCTRCGRNVVDDAAFCSFCGADQRPPTPTAARRLIPLRRSRVDRRVAGICGGIARYLDTDPVFVRVAWVVLSIVPGTILLGVLAYVAAWIIVPEADPGTEPVVTGRPRLRRAVDGASVAGVCAGLAEYFRIDATAVRVLWVLLTIFPGFVICGLIAYAAAWFVMPVDEPLLAAAPPVTPPPGASPPTPDAAGAGASE